MWVAVTARERQGKVGREEGFPITFTTITGREMERGRPRETKKNKKKKSKAYSFLVMTAVSRYTPADRGSAWWLEARLEAGRLELIG